MCRWPDLRCVAACTHGPVLLILNLRRDPLSLSPPLPCPPSFMERAVGAGVHAHLLTEQYRMHPSICTAISNEFYGGRLRTAAVTAARRALLAPCRVVNVKGWEKHHDKAGSSNMKEAKR